MNETKVEELKNQIKIIDDIYTNLDDLRVLSASFMKCLHPEKGGTSRLFAKYAQGAQKKAEELTQSIKDNAAFFERARQSPKFNSFDGANMLSSHRKRSELIPESAQKHTDGSSVATIIPPFSLNLGLDSMKQWMNKIAQEHPESITSVDWPKSNIARVQLKNHIEFQLYVEMEKSCVVASCVSSQTQLLSCSLTKALKDFTKVDDIMLVLLSYNQLYSTTCDKCHKLLSAHRLQFPIRKEIKDGTVHSYHSGCM
ncbi:mediator complex subunit Pmc3/Med27 [Schizosaccharomyces japonicus yFS275]|uniref:Mediator complex subunit Pmc3/Med27 n=1 Tax=Schizosaccharomyces japonicus (strain yFS275 / FY16936) TaxID=402676 RepID=B6JZC3_SCHJY|nr:mediator complex subunit Pmc3/Med27 [Schizosaccharomyces japonicus yFS275]EEB06891.1 mediator complex subunit Pmc3/Med27 [Schizosaccharomyces japonicus yFS275]